MRARPEPLRIVAMSIAIASHVAIALLLFLPAPPLRPLQADEALVVTMVAAPDRAPPPPAPRPAAADPPPRSPNHPARPPAPTGAPAMADAETGASGASPGWSFDPDAGITVVVYGDRGSIDVPPPDQPPAEIDGYRAGFDPSSIDGLNGQAAGGSAVFDVLVDETGAPTALVIVRQACGERALETAMSVVSQWRFVPATKAGVPVPGWMQVELQF